MMWRELPADTRFEDLPDNARWAVDPREPGVQESGPYIVPVSDVDTTGLVSEAKTVDLTRYRKRCEGMPHRNMQDEDCIGSCFEPDDTLQQIADAWTRPPQIPTATGAFPSRRERLRVDWPELAALLDGLVSDE